MRNLRSDSANTYKTNERRLAGIAPQAVLYNSNSIVGANLGNSVSTGPSSLWNFLIGKEKITDSYSWAQISRDGFLLSLLTATTSIGMESGKGKIKKWEPDDIKTFYEKNPDAEFAKNKGGVSLYGIKESIEGSLLEGKYSGEYGSVSAKVGNAEAHWNLEAGMYKYDKTGTSFGRRKFRLKLERA